jgi:LacI family transcriptional regulator
MDAVIAQNPLNAMMGCVAIFNNLPAGREAMHGVEAPRSEIIFRENIPAGDG